MSNSWKKAGECLYRNPSSRTYYALVKFKGKQIKRSLKTKNLPEAKRKLVAFKSELERVDPEAGRVSVTRLCDRFLEAMASQAPKTILRKKLIVERIRSQWKGAPARKIDKSAILTWLSSFDFSAPSYNLHLQTVRAVFRLGVEDRLLATSPVEAGIRPIMIPTD